MLINGAYGSAKAAANYLARSIHRQTGQFGAVVIPYHPGTHLSLSLYAGSD